jgi:hypothetical protein
MILQSEKSEFVLFIFKYTNFICFEEVKEKSSHYGLNMLGYTRATRLKTNRRKDASSNKSIKIN